MPLLIRVMLPRFTGPIERIIKNHAADSVENILFEIITDRLHMIRDNERFIKSVVPELIHRAPLMQQMKTNVLPVIEQFVGKVVDVITSYSIHYTKLYEICVRMKNDSVTYVSRRYVAKIKQVLGL